MNHARTCRPCLGCAIPSDVHGEPLGRVSFKKDKTGRLASAFSTSKRERRGVKALGRGEGVVLRETHHRRQGLSA